MNDVHEIEVDDDVPTSLCMDCARHSSVKNHYRRLHKGRCTLCARDEVNVTHKLSGPGMSARLSTAIKIGRAAKAVLRKTQAFPTRELGTHAEDSQSEHVGVEPMLLALSMELALKAWFAFDYDEPKVLRSHNLIKLFYALELESQEKLDAAFRRSVAPFHPSGSFIDYSILDVLYQHQDAFTDWRYLHEAKNSMLFDQGAFEATLEMVISEFEKRYRVERVTPSAASFREPE
jgi:hypothetical protein